jgi:hypothetical protein
LRHHHIQSLRCQNIWPPLGETHQSEVDTDQRHNLAIDSWPFEHPPRIEIERIHNLSTTECLSQS